MRLKYKCRKGEGRIFLNRKIGYAMVWFIHSCFINLWWNKVKEKGEIAHGFISG